MLLRVGKHLLEFASQRWLSLAKMYGIALEEPMQVTSLSVTNCTVNHPVNHRGVWPSLSRVISPLLQDTYLTVHALGHILIVYMSGAWGKEYQIWDCVPSDWMILYKSEIKLY